MACTANVLLEVEDIVRYRFYYFIQARPGFEANGVEVQLHVDVRMHQKAGTQTTKLKSAKSFVEVHHPRKFIPSKYTRYTVPGFYPNCEKNDGESRPCIGGVYRPKGDTNLNMYVL